MRAISITLAAMLTLTAPACGGASGRAAWPDVASTDRTADDMGLPNVQQDDEGPASEGALEQAAPTTDSPAAS